MHFKNSNLSLLYSSILFFSVKSISNFIPLCHSILISFDSLFLSNIYIKNFGATDFDGDYDNQLMRLALDVGERLLPAFATPTGIPFGTVNLRYGVPEGETEIASTAGAGSLLLELEALSVLSRDNRFGDAAFTAVQALYSRRSYLGLLGKHIHTSNGQWHESSSGIGSNADSFYEYLLKGHLLFHRHSLFAMFDDTYHAVKRHIQVGDWFTEVDMFNGKSRRNRVENLQAFWPGMESVLGLCSSAARLLNAFYAVWLDIGFLPEEFDQAAWLDKKIISNAWYPLRPELIESTYHQYRSTGDRTWLSAGSVFLDAVENNTRTECGYASVSNIATLQLTNNMPSFFLSETCKYLYLLFDEGNFVHDRPYIFTTEAHPFDPLQLPLRANLKSGLVDEKATGKSPNLLPLKCMKGLWWDSGMVAYDAEYVKNQRLRRTSPKSKNTISMVSPTTRRITTAVNSVNVAALLSASSLPSADDSDGALDTWLNNWPLPGVRRSDTCYDSDVKNVSPSSVAVEAVVDQQKRQSPPQKVTVHADSLGEFAVTMYPDGFMVVSKDHGDKLEITNVGESFVFVGHQLSAAHRSRSKTIIGDQTGKTVVCTVALVDRDGRRIEGDEDRSCSIATFGPSSIPSSPIIADLFVPPADNVMVCNPIEPFLPSSVADKGQRSDTSNMEELEDLTSRSWWREWPSASSLSSMLSRGLSKPAANRGQKSGSRIVLARRGNCLFEEKTLIAQTAGASAIIIANNEVNF
jgi:Glycosyl hydrolase family 47